jgi:hypothetical protein
MAVPSWFDYRVIYIDSCELFITMVELDQHPCKLYVYMDLIDKINRLLFLRVLDAMDKPKAGADCLMPHEAKRKPRQGF